MGFPGSIGSSKVWDYSVFDPIVVPPDERRHYKEALVYMPHCYFVNSHKSVIGGKHDGIMISNEDERASLRTKYGIDPSAFVYCCHSRPDKIDPSTFRSWIRAISRVRSSKCTGTTRLPILWLLRSGNEMEQNIRQWVRKEFGNEIMEECLVFANVAERTEHLRRLGIADVFLDTAAYGAHTLGCDALYMGVPMITLMRETEPRGSNGDDSSRLVLDDFADVDSSNTSGNKSNIEMRDIATNKLASRVGASLLNAVGLDDLIYNNMDQYEDAMVRCALDEEWFHTICHQLISMKDSSTLFDTKRWVNNLEVAFREIVKLLGTSEDGGANHHFPDIVVTDDTS